MRGSSPLAGLAAGCILRASSAVLTEVTGFTLSANGWDTRIDGWGCPPSGCVPDNVLDGSLEPDSRWACRPSFSLIDVCELTFTFDQPQDIFEIRMAMFKGNERSRTVNVLVDGVLATTVVTSANTFELEAYAVSATQASTIVLQEAGAEEDVWISMTEVQVMTDSVSEVFPPGPVPTSEEYVGCFKDMVTDRVLTTVVSDDSMTLTACAAKCGEMAKYYYGLQQGNECWCAGCEITERETNTDFDRHGDGICNTECTGDVMAWCGGDMSISLYQSTTCLATPAPTPAFAASGCPSGSTEASLEIIAFSDNTNSRLELHVIEPGGVEVANDYELTKLGDVGTWGRDNDGYGEEFPGYETYLSLNGLNVATDAVLGDYEIWGTGYDGTPWTITARSGGELLWVAGGVFSQFQSETERFTATVTSYAESDCTVDAYGKCPSNSFSSDGLPPCMACPSGLVASGRSTYCTDAALRDLDVPETMADAIIADAAAGWAGPGYAEFNDKDSLHQFFVVGGEESGAVSVSGTFMKYDDTALGSSTALFLYLHTEGSESDFVRGQGEIDPNSGNFTATITDIPVGYHRGILSFIVLDPADAGEDNYSYDTVLPIDVVNEGCSDALRIKLEWDSNEQVDLWVTDPNRNRVSYSSPATDIGYVNDRNGGHYPENPDTGKNSSFEEYVVFSGLSGDAMLGEYRVFARNDYTEETVAWTLTATVNGVVDWVERGELVYMHSSDSYYYTDDDGGSSRRLFTDDYSSSYTSYSSTYLPQTDTFTVILDSYDPAGC